MARSIVCVCGRIVHYNVSQSGLLYTPVGCVKTRSSEPCQQIYQQRPLPLRGLPVAVFPIPSAAKQSRYAKPAIHPLPSSPAQLPSKAPLPPARLGADPALRSPRPAALDSPF
ncbi:uncharacterized protein B0H18DRAFT_1050154 [Fomitopsis serialis]|uniref:uncharacterized protein n=1 Tax=Fomitopsis serialis TaxID=139415 RepID=UPI002008B4ED|nr:uncharacterized protein B0H18DRAFT_1050154 [Neoantrodia serialis]KAH9913233.1 hypothetical protein B0H18DRAFT_1050154 [Neoantrodia serialis]